MAVDWYDVTVNGVDTRMLLNEETAKRYGATLAKPAKQTGNVAPEGAEPKRQRGVSDKRGSAADKSADQSADESADEN